MEDIFSSSLVDREFSDLSHSTVPLFSPFTLPETRYSLENVGSLSKFSEASGSQHSVTGYSFLAFAEKYLDTPAGSMDRRYDSLPCSLSSSSCSPPTNNISRAAKTTTTTDLGASFVSSLFESCVSSYDEENSGELLLPLEDVAK